jgi:hypothetical protein
VLVSNLGQDSHNTEVFRGCPQFLQAYTSIVPLSGHDRLLSNPFQCPPPSFDTTVYKQRCEEQPTIITIYLHHTRPRRHKTSISVHCELVASLHLHLHAFIHLAAQSHAKQIRNTFQLLQTVVFCVMTVVDRYQHFRRNCYLDLQDMTLLSWRWKQQLYPKRWYASTRPKPSASIYRIQESVILKDKGSRFIRNVGIYPLNYTASYPRTPQS